VALDTLKKT